MQALWCPHIAVLDARQSMFDISYVSQCIVEGNTKGLRFLVLLLSCTVSLKYIPHPALVEFVIHGDISL